MFVSYPVNQSNEGELFLLPIRYLVCVVITYIPYPNDITPTKYHTLCEETEASFFSLSTKKKKQMKLLLTLKVEAQETASSFITWIKESPYAWNPL